MTRPRKPKPHTQVPHADRQAGGRVRVEVYLDPTEAACLEVLAKRAGSKRAAIGMALLAAWERL